MTPKKCVNEAAWRMIVRQAEMTRRRRVASGASGGSINGRVSSSIARPLSGSAWSIMLMKIAWIEIQIKHSGDDGWR